MEQQQSQELLVSKVDGELEQKDAKNEIKSKSFTIICGSIHKKATSLQSIRDFNEQQWQRQTCNQSDPESSQKIQKLAEQRFQDKNSNIKINTKNKQKKKDLKRINKQNILHNTFEKNQEELIDDGDSSEIEIVKEFPSHNSNDPQSQNIQQLQNHTGLEKNNKDDSTSRTQVIDENGLTTQPMLPSKQGKGSMLKKTDRIQIIKFYVEDSQELLVMRVNDQEQMIYDFDTVLAVHPTKVAQFLSQSFQEYQNRKE